jgi:hypothetical protein
MLKADFLESQEVLDNVVNVNFLKLQVVIVVQCFFFKLYLFLITLSCLVFHFLVQYIKHIQGISRVIMSPTELKMQLTIHLDGQAGYGRSQTSVKIRHLTETE